MLPIDKQKLAEDVQQMEDGEARDRIEAAGDVVTDLIPEMPEETGDMDLASDEDRLDVPGMDHDIEGTGSSEADSTEPVLLTVEPDSSRCRLADGCNIS